MSITFLCPSCRRRYRVHAQFAGKTTRCPHCQTALTVPVVEAIPLVELAPPDAPPVRVKIVRKNNVWSFWVPVLATLFIVGLLAVSVYVARSVAVDTATPDWPSRR